MATKEDILKMESTANPSPQGQSDPALCRRQPRGGHRQANVQVSPGDQVQVKGSPLLPNKAQQEGDGSPTYAIASRPLRIALSPT